MVGHQQEVLGGLHSSAFEEDCCLNLSEPEFCHSQENSNSIHFKVLS